MSLPLFPVTTVGSWPRPQELLRAFSQKHRRELGRQEFDGVADRAVIAALRAQEEAGADLVTDGEQRRDNFYSFVAEKLDGVQMMTLSEMLDVVEDKQGFARLLATLDVPAFSIRNPTCVGPIRRREALAVDDFEFLRRHTDRSIKVTLPGPYLLTRAIWVKGEISRVPHLPGQRCPRCPQHARGGARAGPDRPARSGHLGCGRARSAVTSAAVRRRRPPTSQGRISSRG